MTASTLSPRLIACCVLALLLEVLLAGCAGPALPSAEPAAEFRSEGVTSQSPPVRASAVHSGISPHAGSNSGRFFSHQRSAASPASDPASPAHSTRAPFAGSMGSTEAEVAPAVVRTLPVIHVAPFALRSAGLAIPPALAAPAISSSGFGTGYSFTLRDSDNDPIPGPDADPPVPGDEYVPGIELDGRIPKVQLPDDLPNPDRWRYVPEGRILDGSIIDRLWVSSFAIPLFFFEEDIGAGGGISITDIDFRNQRRREFAGMFLTYTSEGQQSYRFAWRRWLHHRELDGGGIAQEERSFVSASGGYRRTLTRRFFGFGPDTRERNETSFTDEESSVEFGFQHTYPGHGDDFVMNLGIRAEHRNLSHGEVSDVPDTKNIFPTVFDDADSFDSLWVDFGARYDTRDSQHNPYRGFEIGVFGSSAPAQTGGDVGAIFSLGGSGVIQTPGLFHDGGDDEEEHPPTDVVALGGFVTTVAGNLPFWAIPSLGGSNTLRGYIGNRWTDKVTWHTVAEYRFWVVPRGFTISEKVRIERVGMAVFFELGSVAPHFAALEAKEAKTSYGVSFRASLERQALFRADFGFSPEGFAFTASYGLSF